MGTESDYGRQQKVTSPVGLAVPDIMGISPGAQSTVAPVRFVYFKCVETAAGIGEQTFGTVEKWFVICVQPATVKPLNVPTEASGSQTQGEHFRSSS